MRNHLTEIFVRVNRMIIGAIHTAGLNQARGDEAVIVPHIVTNKLALSAKDDDIKAFDVL